MKLIHKIEEYLVYNSVETQFAMEVLEESCWDWVEGWGIVGYSGNTLSPCTQEIFVKDLKIYF